jgi:mannose-1-phosphate guanylyltransferase/mannose-6-phosphate isomerase
MEYCDLSCGGKWATSMPIKPGELIKQLPIQTEHDELAMQPILPVILAGGGGTRLWPLSRGHYPKQFLAIETGQTLLQGTLTRLAVNGKLPPQFLSPMVVCNEEHRFLVGEQARQAGFPFECIVLEPSGRNTAPALTCAALLASETGADPLLLMMPADHLVGEPANFQAAIEAGCAFAGEGRLVTFGVVPTHPETGYGYIQLGDSLGGPVSANVIAAFKEKPDMPTAEQYLAAGTFRWNAGIFLVSASTWLNAIGAYKPEILASCREAVSQGSRDGEFMRLDHCSARTRANCGRVALRGVVRRRVLVKHLGCFAQGCERQRGPRRRLRDRLPRQSDLCRK